MPKKCLMQSGARSNHARPLYPKYATRTTIHPHTGICKNNIRKLENVKQEMTRLGINILGISETRWLRKDDFYSDGFRI